MVDKMLKDLQAVGFQEKEARVYLASLELGQATAQQIAIKAELKRPTTYFILEGLMGQGLASSFHHGKKQFFVAETPDRLLELLDQERREIAEREEKFRALLPQLQSINNRQKDKPVVKYYEGKEGIVSMVKNCVESSKGQEVYAAFSQDIIDEVFDESTLQDLITYRVSKDVKSRGMYVDSNHKEGDRYAKIHHTESVRLTSKEFPMSCDVAIYEDKIRIASLKERLVGIVIEDKEIAQSFRVLYDMAWKWIRSQNR